MNLQFHCSHLLQFPHFLSLRVFPVEDDHQLSFFSFFLFFLSSEKSSCRKKREIKKKKKNREQEVSPPDQLGSFLAAPPGAQSERSVRQSNLQVKRETSSLPLSLSLYASPSVACARSTCSNRCGRAHTAAAFPALPLVSERCAVAPSMPPRSSLPLPPSLPPSITPRLMNV